ncbi:Gfo/Idh/MocA family protein [Alkalicoccobacillus gibsonii]|uniref:Gfo/Idh/MocA family protein n=1 Tax=Alkalicoccobacillus gibsonii TaxID=79881 RepID=UPI0035122A6D
MLQIAVIGLGDISALHLAAIKGSELASLVAVCDHDPSLKGKAEGVPFYTDYMELLSEEQPDCVHICLPHHLHDEVTRACVKKGVHVFLEKPITTNAESSLSLIELVENQKEAKVCICLQNRLNATVQELRKIVKSGELGRIIGIKGLVTWHRPSSYYDVKPWRGTMKGSGGGVMINQAIHTLDLMQLLGGDVHSIRGSIDCLIENKHEVEDTAIAHLSFKSGATGLFFATNANATNDSVEVQVAFEKGECTIKDSILTKKWADGKKEFVVEDEKVAGTKFYYGASHAKLIHQFYQCIATDSDEYIHVREAQSSMELIQAIRDSSEQNKRINLEGSITI